MSKDKIIAPVETPTDWVSNLVVVKKTNNKLRLCLDPKDLNKAIRRPHYHMPTIEDMAPDLTKAKVFTVVDAKDGFWQVKLSEKSSYYTTFNTPYGRYRWLRMPFGICSASEEFQRRINTALEGLPGVKVIVDDILIYGKGDDIEEANRDHDRNLIALLKRLRYHNIKLNPDKIKFKLKEVSYMGHLLTENGLKVDPLKLKSLDLIQPPKNIK